MIEGQVTTNREAIVQVTVRGPTGDELEIDAVVDTGFDGWLTLPAELVKRLSFDLAATRFRVAGGWQRNSL